MKKLIVVSSMFVAALAFGWGTGHDTVARETLRVLPGIWGEKLRAGEGGKELLHACHGPDDQSTKLSDKAEYMDAEIQSALDQHNGKPPVMYRLHAADARCELIRAMARAIKKGDDKALGFLLGCFNHSVADTVAANHSPLLQLVIYNWRALGLNASVSTECTVLEKDDAGRAAMYAATSEVLSKYLVGREPATPAEVYAACYMDEITGTDYYRYDRDFSVGGAPALKAFAAEAAYAVRRTCEALLAAERFAVLAEVPAFDEKAEAAAFNKRKDEFLATRDMSIDALTKGLLAKEGSVPKIGVVYDPTGFWTRGVMLMVNRSLSAQICTTLKKKHDAALLDLREIVTKGVPDGVEALVVPACGMANFGPFSADDLVKSIKKYADNGGKVIWVGGKTRPPANLFPEAKTFTDNPIKGGYTIMRTPVPVDEAVGSKLTLPNGKAFTCVRKPKGGAGWYWDQLDLAFIPPQTLPEGAKPALNFVDTKGASTLVGYSRGKVTFLPAFALYPFVFTEEVPSLTPLKLELDSAGAAILESVLQ